LSVPRPREGLCGGAKIFGAALLQPASAQCLRLSERFFSFTDVLKSSGHLQNIEDLEKISGYFRTTPRPVHSVNAQTGMLQTDGRTNERQRNVESHAKDATAQQSKQQVLRHIADRSKYIKPQPIQPARPPRGDSVPDPSPHPSVYIRYIRQRMRIPAANAYHKRLTVPIFAPYFADLTDLYWALSQRRRR